MATQGLMTSQLADMLQAGMSPEEIRMQMADAKAMEWAKMPTSQKMSYNIGRSVGGFTDSLLNAFGVQQQDPALAKATQLAQIRNEIDPTNEKSIIAGAQKLAQLGFGREAQELATKALATREKESIIAKNLREKAAADPLNKLVEAAKYTPESIAEYQKSGKIADLKLIEKPDANKPTSEFERLVDSLPISDENKQAMKAQRATALMSGDSSGLKAVSAELAQARLDALKLETRLKEDKATDEKRTAISKLSDVESAVDTSLSTAERALKLAPGTMLQATNQALFNNIPFSDAKSMKNLVGSLNSEKAIQTLEQMKTQSRTGATGFGALNTSELQLIIDKTRSLDPTDKMFKENLGIVMDGWRKIKNSSMESRINLQGKGDKLKELRSKVAAVKAKASMTAQEKAEIDALKADLGVN